jgi:hypothetical protein
VKMGSSVVAYRFTLTARSQRQPRTSQRHLNNKGVISPV